MTKRLIAYNSYAGIATYHEYDSAQRKILITFKYDDTASVLENNKRARTDFDRSQQNESWWKVASIPLSICTKWMVEEGIHVFNKRDFYRVKQKLNDPEWAYLRTSPGDV